MHQRHFNLTCFFGVYPRVCGGTLSSRCGRSDREGLSPRVRGNRFGYFGYFIWHGSIPACAGEPPGGHPFFVGFWVYPRVCGGTRASKSSAGNAPGLSPRVRGNPGEPATPQVPSGSIPACAGEPCRRDAPYLPLGVYPRVCGGTLTTPSVSMASRGLSPRVRGNHNLAVGALRCIGSIPACAGEPWTWIPLRSMTRVYPRVCGGTLSGKCS